MNQIKLFVVAFFALMLLVAGGVVSAWTSSNINSWPAWFFLVLYFAMALGFSSRVPPFLPYSIILPVACSIMVHTPAHKALIYGPGLLLLALLFSYLLSRRSPAMRVSKISTDKIRLGILLGIAFPQLLVFFLVLGLSINRDNLLEFHSLKYTLSFLTISCGIPGILLVWRNLRKGWPTKRLFFLSIAIQVFFIELCLFWGADWYFVVFFLCLALYGVLLIFSIRRGLNASPPG